jgi:hypothetical protein
MRIPISYCDGFIRNFERMLDDVSGHEYRSTGIAVFFDYVVQL